MSPTAYTVDNDESSAQFRMLEDARKTLSFKANPPTDSHDLRRLDLDSKLDSDARRLAVRYCEDPDKDSCYSRSGE